MKHTPKELWNKSENPVSKTGYKASFQSKKMNWIFYLLKFLLAILSLFSFFSRKGYYFVSSFVDMIVGVSSIIYENYYLHVDAVLRGITIYCVYYKYPFTSFGRRIFENISLMMLRSINWVTGMKTAINQKLNFNSLCTSLVGVQYYEDGTRGLSGDSLNRDLVYRSFTLNTLTNQLYWTGAG